MGSAEHIVKVFLWMCMQQSMIANNYEWIVPENWACKFGKSNRNSNSMTIDRYLNPHVHNNLFLLSVMTVRRFKDEPEGMWVTWEQVKKCSAIGFDMRNDIYLTDFLPTIKRRIIERTWVDKGSDGIWMALKMKGWVISIFMEFYDACRHIFVYDFP